MTTKAQLRRTASSLPGAEEDGSKSLPSFSVAGRRFAELTADGLVRLQLDADTVRRSVTGVTITEATSPHGAPEGVAVALAEVNGMELNSLVFKSWLAVAPEELAASARSALGGAAPDVPNGLPAGLGKPATRALLLAGITDLTQVAARTEAELLELHGVGPRAVRILREALQANGRDLPS